MNPTTFCNLVRRQLARFRSRHCLNKQFNFKANDLFSTTKVNPKFLAAVTRAASSGDWAWYSKLPTTWIRALVRKIAQNTNPPHPPRILRLWRIAKTALSKVKWHKTRKKNSISIENVFNVWVLRKWRQLNEKTEVLTVVFLDHNCMTNS